MPKKLKNNHAIRGIDEFLTPEQAMQQYTLLLRSLLVDGIISAHEEAIMDDFRHNHNLSDEQHIEALQSIGFTLEMYKLCIYLGHEEDPEHLYGPGTLYTDIETRFYNPEFYPSQFRGCCAGAVSLPTLRQFFEWSDDRKSIKYYWREKGERKASTAELFFDLVFVAFIFNLGHDYSYDIYYIFLLMYTSAWMIWNTVLQLVTRYEMSHSWFFLPLYLWHMFCIVSAIIDISMFHTLYMKIKEIN
jgi:hypothetical protein